jgi:hypothetical protein
MCQAVHAAHEAGIHLANKENGISSVVICSVPNESRLHEAENKLTNRDIRTVMFYEPDLGDQATALATEPISGDARKALSNYPLWRN